MGYEILVAFFAFIALPLVLGGFGVFWAMTNRERTELEDTFRAIAERSGRTYVRARGEWPNRTSPGIEWSKDGVRYRLECRGRDAAARTRLSAWPDAKVLGVICVRPGRSDRALATRDAFFAAAFAIAERPPGVSARVLDAEVRRALLAFRQRDDVSLTYRRGRLVLEWPGRERSEARIAEAERVLEAAVDALRAAFKGAIAA